MLEIYSGCLVFRGIGSSHGVAPCFGVDQVVRQTRPGSLVIYTFIVIALRATGAAIFVLLALLFAVPTAAADFKKDVPVTVDWRIYQPGPGSCTSWGIVTWPAQEGAIGWELLDAFNGSPRSKTLSPPFSDEEFTEWGWSPGEGMHWHGLSRAGRFHLGGGAVSCDEIQARQKASISDVRLIVTIRGPSCSALKSRAQRLQRRMKSARNGNLKARKRLASSRKQVTAASERLREARADGSAAAAERAQGARQRAEVRRQVSREAVRSTQKALRETRQVLKEARTKIKENAHCPAR